MDVYQIEFLWRYCSTIYRYNTHTQFQTRLPKHQDLRRVKLVHILPDFYWLTGSCSLQPLSRSCRQSSDPTCIILKRTPPTAGGPPLEPGEHLSNPKCPSLIFWPFLHVNLTLQPPGYLYRRQLSGLRTETSNKHLTKAALPKLDA